MKKWNSSSQLPLEGLAVKSRWRNVNKTTVCCYIVSVSSQNSQLYTHQNHECSIWHDFISNYDLNHGSLKSAKTSKPNSPFQPIQRKHSQSSSFPLQLQQQHKAIQTPQISSSYLRKKHKKKQTSWLRYSSGDDGWWWWLWSSWS